MLPVRVLEQAGGRAGALTRLTGAAKGLPSSVVLARRSNDRGSERWSYGPTITTDQWSVMLSGGRLSCCPRASHLLVS